MLAYMLLHRGICSFGALYYYKCDGFENCSCGHEYKLLVELNNTIGAYSSHCDCIISFIEKIDQLFKNAATKTFSLLDGAAI